jgi:hypothetical protein
MSMSVPISLDHGQDDMSDTSSLSAPTFDSGLSSSESTSTPSSSGTGTSDPTKKRRIVTKMTEKQIRHFLEYFAKSKLSQNKFADANDISRSTFKGYVKDSGIGVNIGTGDEQERQFLIQQKINAYLAQRVRNEGKRHNFEHLSFLSEEEQQLLIQYASSLAIIGHGISKRVLLDLINAIVNLNVERRDEKPCTFAVVEKMIKKHPGLMKLVKANSLDPQRAKKATKEVRNHYFSKLDNFIKMTNSIGIHTWKSAADVPARNWYNMDEKSVNPNAALDKVSLRTITQYIFVFI